MRLAITDHAKLMLRERVGCKPGKFQKLAEKAYRSKEPVRDRDICNPRFYAEIHGQEAIFRKLMGKIYVFVHAKDGPYGILITVYPPAIKASHGRPKPRIIPPR